MDEALLNIIDFLGRHGLETVTALSTLTLAVLTYFLARSTKALAQESSKPMVVASLEHNQWSIGHFDLVLENSGNAPAFDVRVLFDPPLPFDLPKSVKNQPLHSLNILRPNQNIKAYVNDFASLSEMDFHVTVTWKRNPRSKKVESLEYNLPASGSGSLSTLGSRSPMLQIAEQIKHLREDWKAISGGTRKLQIDSHSQRDREDERKRSEKAFEEMRNQFKLGEDE